MNTPQTPGNAKAPRTPLSQGNEALRKGDYAQAIAHYAQVIRQHPEMAKSISANVKLARQKYRASRQVIEKPSVAVCAWELAHNAAGRAYTLATIYETFAHVEIIGSLFPSFGREIWEPIRDTPIAKHSFIVEDESKFLEQAIQLVATHPYDIVHLSKPRAPNIFFGILYKLFWDAKVLMDIDDEELAFVREEAPISIDDYIKQHGKLPELKNLAGKEWTRLAVGLAKEFDGVTVCNTALQQRYGVEIIRHARDEKLFKPSPELKRKSRDKYGIPQDKKVVLFFGTPREHKGLVETAQAIAGLNRADVIFCIVGTFKDEKLKQRLMAVEGCNFVFLPNQPITDAPEILSIADCCVLLQDTKSTAAQYQTPAKLSDALAMGIPVLASITPALEEYVQLGAIQKTSIQELKQNIAQVLKPITQEADKESNGRSTFIKLLSITACAKSLKHSLSQLSSAPKSQAILNKAHLLFSELSPNGHIPTAIVNLLKNTPSEQKHRITSLLKDTSIDIVVPVFNALDDVKRCLASLEEHTDGFKVRVFVINDGSDEDTTQWLRNHCQGNPLFSLIEHPKNLGYTRAVNTGLKASDADFVITQNSDTIVSAGWLNGMVRCMASDPKIGIVGPLSNAASWQNVPNLLDESGGFAVNELPDGLDVQGMARIVAKASQRTYPRLPFVNGFCFMIRRAVIDAIGYMDEENFPIGYGEDNDFCIRSIDAGYELAIADDVFVFHAKSKSFGHDRCKQLSAQGTETLRRKHTEERYTALVAKVKCSEALDSVRSRIGEAMGARSAAVSDTQGQFSVASVGSDNYFLGVLGKSDLGIVILNHNGAALLSRLFESIDRNRPALSFRIFVTDHCSTDDSKAVISYWSGILPIHSYFAPENYSFSFSNNRWVEQLVGCEKILFLNNDIVFESNVIDLMAKVLDDPLVGIVGIDQWEPLAENGTRQWHHRGIGFTWDPQYEFWRPFNIRSPRPENEPTTRIVPAVTGSVMMIRRSDFLGLGGFDEGYVYGYEDVDLCLSCESKLGKRTVCVTSNDVIHADGATRKKTQREELRNQRLGNIELFRTKFSSKVARMQRRLLTAAYSLSQRPPRVAFAVTEVGGNASAGDLFTAMELGRALESEFGWSISYRPRGEQWYTLADVDIVIAMVDAYDPRRIQGAHPALIKIAWARNWFERWCDHVWHDEYDLYFASSKLSADYITRRIGLPARVLRIAANTERFNISNRPLSATYDFVFTGSYWNAEREIVGALAALPKSLKGAIYGKNWEKVPQLRDLTRGFVPYEQLPNVYRNTKIVIDDANHVTKPWGSVNSRVFDALAAGCLVVTNSSLASNDAFEGELPVYESPDQLAELLSKYSRDDTARQQLVCNLRNRVLAEHTYAHRAYEFRDHLRSHFSSFLRFAIKIPVPKREVAHEWGDYHFAESLAKEIRALGNRVRIDFLPDWERGDAEGDDVTLVLRGLSEYRVRQRQFNLIWLISHPDKVSDAELNDYDRVFVASDSYAEKLSLRLRVPVEALLQCTDGQRFNPRSQVSSYKVASDILFVGNSRNQFRRIIKDAISVGLRPDIYGTRWEQFVNGEFIKGQNIPNVDLPGYYAKSNVVLNDHWDDMAKNGFISNRLFDAVACGAQVISDRCVGIDSIFGSAVKTYSSASDLKGLVEDARREKCKGFQPRVVARILSDHSFHSRAKQILSSIKIT